MELDENECKICRPRGSKHPGRSQGKMSGRVLPMRAHSSSGQQEVDTASCLKCLKMKKFR